MVIDETVVNPWEQRWTVKPDIYSILYGALHFDPTKDAFPPTRNLALLGALEKAEKFFPDGKKLLEKEIAGELDQTSERMKQGRTIIQTLSFGERMWPSAPVEVRLTPEIKRRALWWNERAKTVLESVGIEGLINDPALVCLALGTGQWLDAGNFMVEPRFVGDSLASAKKAGIDLYQRFDLKPEDFVFFPHVKHKPGFYNETYKQLLFGGDVTEKVFLESHRLIYDLMKLNKQNVLLVPGTWLYDPNLPEISSATGWIGKTAEKIVVLGKAKDLDQIQLKFAISQSARRRKLYRQGKYQPQIAAAYTSQRFLGDMLQSVHGKTGAETAFGAG